MMTVSGGTVGSGFGSSADRVTVGCGAALGCAGFGGVWASRHAAGHTNSIVRKKLIWPIVTSRPATPGPGSPDLPVEPQRKLCHPRRAARISHAQEAVRRDRGRVVRVVQDVEEVNAEPNRKPLRNSHGFERRGVEEPLVGPVPELISPRM